MPIAHVAYTEHNVLMLDEAGICVRVEPLNARRAAPTADGAVRCIGAQYVASIDPTEPGGLTDLPRVGTSMLFAAVDTSGRIFCVRAGPLTHFESNEADDSGVHTTPTSERESRSSVWLDEATDPGFEIDFEEDDEDDDPFPDAETARFEPPRPLSSKPPPPRSGPVGPPRSGYGVRTENPPPPPRVPRLRPSLPSLPPERPSAPSMRGHDFGVPPTRPTLPSSPSRGRPPLPSSHAWLRDSASLGGRRRR